jgi:hypothetical protein
VRAYRDLNPLAYLRIWPGSDPAKLHMRRIEEFVHTNYRPLDRAPNGDGELRLLRRIDPFSRS